MTINRKASLITLLLTVLFSGTSKAGVLAYEYPVAGAIAGTVAVTGITTIPLIARKSSCAILSKIGQKLHKNPDFKVSQTYGHLVSSSALATLIAIGLKYYAPNNKEEEKEYHYSSTLFNKDDDHAEEAAFFDTAIKTACSITVLTSLLALKPLRPIASLLNKVADLTDKKIGL